jgi:hypothetical protein
MFAISSYHRHLTSDVDGASIDDRTWRDLDLDLVFALLDRTVSGVGQQSLYHRLRSRTSLNTLRAFEALTARMSTDVPLRERCQMALAPLRGFGAFSLWQLAEPGVLEVRRTDVLSPLLALAVLVTAATAFWWSTAFVILVALLPACLAVRILNARRIAEIIEPFRLLGPLIAAADTLQSVVDAQNAGLTQPLVSDAQSLARLRIVAGWLARDSATMDPLTGVIFELLSFLLALDGNALSLGGLELRRHRANLSRTIAAVGEVDCAIAIASYRGSSGRWTRPSFQDPSAPVLIRDLRHPLLPEAVPNSVRFAPPHGVLITGSNMSGKSTFLRSMGLAAVMSRTINTCVADEYVCPLLWVRSCMGRSDSLVEGRSYYLDEVQGVLSLIEASQSSEMQVCLLDELFRGTNAFERVGAAEAALRQFTKAATPHLVIAATHDIELTSLLADAYTTFHFADRLTSEVFEYRLAQGPSRTRNAITLLEMNGAPADIVARARLLAGRLEEKAKDS